MSNITTHTQQSVNFSTIKHGKGELTT